MKGIFFDWLSEYRNSLKNGEKKIPKDMIIVVFLVGILLFVISLPINNNSSYSNKNVLDNKSFYEANKTDENNLKKEMEKELEEFVSNVEGVGQVKALIYYEEDEGTPFSDKSKKNKISGVVIAAEGAESEFVRGQIIHLVMVLYGLKIDNVEVFVLKK